VVDEDGIGTLNPIRYRGYYYDQETGLFYLKSRYYDPDTGRFINADDPSVLDLTKGDINGFNLYAYCRNMPIMMVDSTGCLAILTVIAGILVTALISGLIGGASSAATATSIGQDAFAAFVGGFVTGAICGVGLGIAMAVGGIWGLVIATGIGFAGGFLGSITEQSIAGHNVDGYTGIDWGKAAGNGLISAATNALSYSFFAGVRFVDGATDIIFPIGKTLGERLVNAFALDLATMYITSVMAGGALSLFEAIARLISFYGSGKHYGDDSTLSKKRLSNGVWSRN
jgi:RHS repeat-associated protein